TGGPTRLGDHLLSGIPQHLPSDRIGSAEVTELLVTRSTIQLLQRVVEDMGEGEPWIPIHDRPHSFGPSAVGVPQSMLGLLHRRGERRYVESVCGAGRVTQDEIGDLRTVRLPCLELSLGRRCDAELPDDVLRR